MARIVAIDLGRHAAKAVVIDSSSRGSTVEGYFSEPVEDDGEGRQAPIGARLAALDVLLETNHTWQSPSTTVVLAWAADSVSTRVVELPFTDKTQIEQTLPFTVEEMVPFDMEDMVLGWRALPNAGEGTRAHVTLVPLEMLRNTVEALQERSVDPARIVVDGEALGTLTPAEGVCAVVDVGHASTVISVMQDGRVVSERAIDVAGRRFTLAIAGALEVSYGAAERLKHGEYAPDEEPTEGGLDTPMALAAPAARKALDDAFGLLLAEVRGTLIAAEDNHGLDIERVFLTGGGARLQPLPDYLQRDLGLEIEWLMDGDSVPVPPEHGVARSLAEMVASGRHAVNLRTGPLEFKGGVNILRAVVTYGAAGVAFFLFAATVVFAIQFFRLSSEQAEVDAQIRSIVLTDFPDTDPSLLDVGDDAAAVMEGNVLRMEARADDLAGNPVPPTIDMVHKLTQAMPDPEQVTVDISDLTIGQVSMTFNAETDTFESAAAIETAVQAVPEFADAVKSNERRQRDKVQFTMTIPFESPADEGGAQ